MTLQWQRQVEMWLSMLGIQATAAPKLCIIKDPNRIYLESVNERALITTRCPLDERAREQALLKALTFVRPEMIQGVPCRVWWASGSMWLSTLAPEETGAELWTQIVRQQLVIIERSIRGLHGS